MDQKHNAIACHSTYMADKNADHPWHDKELLMELYHEKQMKLKEVADELDCGISTIRKWMNRHDIERRSLAEARAISREYGKSVHFHTHQNGYEYAKIEHRGEADTVYIHRLLAVAEFGFDEVSDKQVHHKYHIPWDNRPEAIELVDPDEHQTQHLHVHYGNKPMPKP